MINYTFGVFGGKDELTYLFWQIMAIDLNIEISHAPFVAMKKYSSGSNTFRYPSKQLSLMKKHSNAIIGDLLDLTRTRNKNFLNVLWFCSAECK